MKVFYKHETWAPPNPGEVEKADVEEVALPAQLFEELGRVLSLSQRILPVGARKFQGWDVGLLERFDVGDVRESVVDGL
jgi:hypothetical protein